MFHTRLIVFTLCCAIMAAVSVSAQDDKIQKIEELVKQAQTFKDAKDYTNSIACLEKSLLMATELNKPAVNVFILNEIAATYWQAENYIKAKTTYQKSLTILETSEWPEKKVICLASLGKLAMFLDKDSVLAESYLLKAITVAESISDTNTTTYCYDNLASLAFAWKKWEQAWQYREKARKIYEKQNDAENQGLMYWYMAEYAEAQKKYVEAAGYYEKGAGLYITAGNKPYAMSMFIGVGDNQNRLEKYEAALDAYRKALALAVETGNKEKQGFILWDIAYEYDMMKKYKESIAHYGKSYDVYLALGNKSNAGTLQSNMAKNYTSIGDVPQAIECYKKAISLRKEGREEASVATNLDDLASLYWKQKDYGHARDNYLESQKIYQKLNDKEGQIYALVNLGSINSFFENNFAQAENYFSQALKFTQEAKNENMTAFCYEKLAEIYERKGKLEQFKEYKEKALAIYRKLDDKVKIAFVTINFGNYATQKGAYDEGMKYFNQAREMGEQIPSKEVMASAYLSMSWVQSSINGEYKNAMDNLQKSLDIYRELQNEFGVADVYHSMSNCQITFGEYKAAEANLHKADSVYAILNSDMLRADIYNTKGRLYFYQQDVEKSLQSHKAGYDIRTRLNDRSESFSVSSLNVGECLASLKRYEEAIPYIQNSLALTEKRQDKRGRSSSLEMLGEVKLEQKKYAEAETLLTQALQLLVEIKSQEHLASVNRLKAKLYYETKQYDKAIPFAEEAVKISEKIGSDFYLWEALYILGMIHKDQNKLLKSKVYLKSSVEVIEKIRNRITGGEAAQKLFSSSETKVKVYENLVDVLLKLGEVDGAMEYMERNHTDEMNVRFRNIKVKYEDEKKNKSQEEAKTRQARVEGIEKQISLEKSKPSEEQDAGKLQKLESIKNVASADYVSFVRKNIRTDADKYIDLRLNRGKIPKDMALVSYLPGENQLYIFVATRDSAIARVVPVSSAEIRKIVNAVRNQIKLKVGTVKNALDTSNAQNKRNELFPGIKQTDPLLMNLETAYSYLIAPIQDAIKTKKQLAIMPADKLHFLPFQLIGKTLANGSFNFLLENYTIFYTKDFKMLSRDGQTDAAGIKIIAFGNPDETLPAAEQEIQLIKQNFPNTQAYLRTEATEDRAKNLSPEYNIAHFATHGNLDYSKPELSYLTMAKNLAKGEDGNLSLQDLWGLDLMNNLNLVILSACNSAMSSDAEMPISPATGFFDNGVKAVIASLWAVNDEATSLLMADFYKNIKTMNVADAFRVSQVKITKNAKYRHPYYWAPFILQGDWK